MEEENLLSTPLPARVLASGDIGSSQGMRRGRQGGLASACVSASGCGGVPGWVAVAAHLPVLLLLHAAPVNERGEELLERNVAVVVGVHLAHLCV